MNQRHDVHIPPLLLERAKHGELEQERLERFLERSGLSRSDFERRVDALREEDARILAAHPTSEMAPKIRLALEARRAHTPTPTTAPRAQRSHWFWGAGGAIAAAAATVLVLQGGFFQKPTAEQPREHARVIGEHDPIEITRLKGAEPELQIWRQADPPEKLEQGAIASEGDNLQIKYQAGAAKHGVILSVDGRGSVTLHFPSTTSADTTLERGVHALEYGYQLDDAPDFEQFLFVTSTQPIDVADLLEQVEERAERAPGEKLDLDLVQDKKQDRATFVLRKKRGDAP